MTGGEESCDWIKTVLELLDDVKMLQRGPTAPILSGDCEGGYQISAYRYLLTKTSATGCLGLVLRDPESKKPQICSIPESKAGVEFHQPGYIRG